MLEFRMSTMEELSLEERLRFHKTFKTLKSACDKIALSPNKQSCKELNSALKGLDPAMISQFKSYIFFPIFIHLGNKKAQKRETVCHLLDSLQAVLEMTLVEESSHFWRIFSLILLQLDDSKPETLLELPEELKLMVVKCLNTLLNKTSKTVLEDVYSRNYYPKISIAMYSCIQIAKSEKFITLRLEALQCLLTFIQAHEKYQDPDFKERVASIIMLMVPGIMSVCIEVVTNSITQNHKLILIAIQIWGRTIGLVMEDSLLYGPIPKVFKMNPNTKPIDQLKPNTPEDMKMIINGQKRDKNWLETTGKMLSKVVVVMVQQMQHENWRVRKKLVLEIDYILSEASRSMVSSLNFLIDTLIILSQDEHIEVVKASKRVIEQFSTKCDANKERKLMEIIEECLYALLTRLPRILRGVDLSIKESHLQLLSGYFDLLGSKTLQKITNSVQHLSRLLRSLQIAATLECNMISLLEEMAIREVDEESNIKDSVWKQLKYASTPKCQLCLENVCKKLVEYADMSVIVHSLLDEFNSSTQYRKEIILILHYMLSTENPGTYSEKEDLLRNILITIMEPLLAWKLPVTVGKDGAETRAEAQANVIQTCLLTECVATIATALGKDAFAPLILRCLYPLLESAGSPLFAISIAGLKSVNRIASLYGGGVGDLVAQNVDYLSHHVTVNLKYVEKNPKVLSVLSVIMKHSTIDVLPSLYDIVNDVLVQSCDTFQEVNCLAFLHVFHTFVSCLLEWLKNKAPYKKVDTEINLVAERPSLCEELLEYHKAMHDSEAWMRPDENIQNENITVEEMTKGRETEEKIKPPDYVKFTIDILKRSLHFLPSKDKQQQIIVLQILEKGILILSPWEDDLLPITYKIWSPLVTRFSYRNSPLIIHRAFVLLTTLGNTSKDFVRAQTLKEVMPSLCKVLSDSAEKSKNEKSTGSYVLSQQYKLQLALLKDIGTLCANMDVLGKELECVLDALDLYLSKFQPKALQEACQSSYLRIAFKEANVVWVHLMSINPYNRKVAASHQLLTSFTVRGRNVDIHEYKDNIDSILGRIV
ncbi:TELO2-interacting protein 1 homolog isoform X2 [Cimex lectularius]|uniref:TELO2-interacting protein 1 homolog n=1 Tax=Cimex lectularius TaxID=79782 RepID=A0A8I6SA44_CIMLE|nr:TELO2-interacting protein 1 homolog isoform X2 [Cimex lectularius]